MDTDRLAGWVTFWVDSGGSTQQSKPAFDLILSCPGSVSLVPWHLPTRKPNTENNEKNRTIMISQQQEGQANGLSDCSIPFPDWFALISALLVWPREMDQNLWFSLARSEPKCAHPFSLCKLWPSVTWKRAEISWNGLQILLQRTRIDQEIVWEHLKYEIIFSQFLVEANLSCFCEKKLINLKFLFFEKSCLNSHWT